VLQVVEGASCVLQSLGVASDLFLPCSSGWDPLLWREPFPAASLFVPSVLDSCFKLLEKLSHTPGSQLGSMNWIRNDEENISTSCSKSARFGQGPATVTCAHLVSFP
jgi:hypothetical protein